MHISESKKPLIYLTRQIFIYRVLSNTIIGNLLSLATFYNQLTTIFNPEPITRSKNNRLN